MIKILLWWGRTSRDKWISNEMFRMNWLIFWLHTISSLNKSNSSSRLRQVDIKDFPSIHNWSFFCCNFASNLIWKVMKIFVSLSVRASYRLGIYTKHRLKTMWKQFGWDIMFLCNMARLRSVVLRNTSWLFLRMLLECYNVIITHFYQLYNFFYLGWGVHDLFSLS